MDPIQNKNPDSHEQRDYYYRDSRGQNVPEVFPTIRCVHAQTLDGQELRLERSDGLRLTIDSKQLRFAVDKCAHNRGIITPSEASLLAQVANLVLG